MIGWHEISSADDAASYHEKAFSKDGNIQKADNYYLDRSAEATWQGTGAKLLGIEGKTVTSEEFKDLLNGRVTNPATGKMQDLAGGGNADRRKGMDLVVSAPKSVSVAALVGNDERLVEAHKEAAHAALTWLEKNGALLRIKGSDGKAVAVQSGNLVWATIKHETNRDNEPQLHNHNVVVAMTYDVDNQKWRSLTNDEMMQLRRMADDVYKGELHARVVRLGYETRQTADGFEIAGMSKEQLEGFSGRSAAIDEHIKARGYDPEQASWAMRQTAALATRARKEDIPYEVLHEAWNARSKELGLDAQGLAQESRERATKLDFTAMAAEDQRQARIAVSEAIEHLSTREQAFTVAQLEGTTLGMAKLPVSSVQDAINDHVRGHQLIEREGMDSPLKWFTTEKALEQERRLVEIIQAGKDYGHTVIASEKEFHDLLSRFEARKSEELGIKFKLSVEQEAAAKAVLMHADRWQGIQGDAGTGKTAGLEFVREAAEAKGWNIQGVATMARAARELGDATGIQSNTIASYFAQKERAMQDLKLEIDGLWNQLKTNGPLRDTDTPRTEVRVLHAKSFDLDFGERRYVFDHQRGEVYRTGESLLSKFGSSLLDSAAASRQSQELEPRALSERLQAIAAEKINDIKSSVGSALVTYEKVEVVEAHAARTALYRENEEARRSEIGKRLGEAQAKLSNLERFGNERGTPTLYVMDETSMTGVGDMVRFANFVESVGGRGVFQGDSWQHGSVSAGKAFEQMQTAGLNVSTLKETRRFDRATPQTQEAVRSIQDRGYAEAIAKLDRREVTSEKFHETIAQRYVDNWRELQAKGVERPSIGVVAITNDDRKQANEAIHKALAREGVVGSVQMNRQHFDDSQLTAAQNRNAGILAKEKVTHVTFSQGYRELGVKANDVLAIERLDIEKNRIIGRVESTGRLVEMNPDKQSNFQTWIAEKRAFSLNDQVESRAKIAGTERIDNGMRGTVTAVTEAGLQVKWSDGRTTQLSNHQARFVDHAYAHTSFKEQGQTNHREIIAVSNTGAKVFNREASYVAATRAKDNTEVITTNYEAMLKNAGKDVKKTTAADVGVLSGQSQVRHSDLALALLDSEKSGRDSGVGVKQPDLTRSEKIMEKQSGVERGM